ncbi:MAG TPA: dienelactone hydrolase family protein [Vicinamibacterales bacterium]|nr:dienelactone hydrolase family protein [Vicinamibacterales bacterium]
MLTQEIHYRDGVADLTGVLIRDEHHPDHRPGVLVVHGGGGLDAHARKQARRVADAGYVAFACDMYGAGVTGDREKVVREIHAFRADRTRLTLRAKAGLDVLASQTHLDGRIAVVGYCFGGLVALELARSGIELAAVVSVHGTLTTTQPVETRAIQAPILACQGALDPHCSLADAMRFADEMRSLDADWEMAIYGNAMHGFTHEDAKGQMPGVQYDADADARSLSTIYAFLARQFARVC